MQYYDEYLGQAIAVQGLAVYIGVTGKKDFAFLLVLRAARGRKAHLTKQVEENNKSGFFQPYKDLCTLRSSMILEYNPDYKIPKSLASTIVEIAHFRNFFMHNFSSLTDFSKRNQKSEIVEFLEELVFSSLGRR